MGKGIISSYKTTIVLLLVYAFGLAIATFIEKYEGTELAKTLVYHSPVFIFLHILLILNFILSSLRYRLLKKGKSGFIVIHFSLIIILAGAFVSHIFSREGVLHLREGESLDQMLVQTKNGESRHALPFRIELKKFVLKRYPGSFSPSDFESHLVIYTDGRSFEKKVSMNNVLDLKGYRFFQASYDNDEKGTVLSVNRDVAGRNITYTGYILLGIGFILCFTGKNSRLRQLTLQLKRLKNSALLVAFGLLAFGLPAGAQNPSVESIINFFQQKTIDPAHAARFGALPQQSIDGRIEPVNTFSSEVLRKLHHSDKIGPLNSDQFLLSMLAFPEMWMQIPFISIKNEYIVLKYDLHKKQCAYAELFDAEGKYKLQNDLNKIFEKTPSKRSKFDKDLIKLNEQITIFYQLVEGELLNLFPISGDPNHKWQASDDLLNKYLENVRSALITGDWTPANRSLDAMTAFQEKNSTLTIDNQKIKRELLYNRLNIFQQCKKIYLIAGGLLLVLTFFSLFRKSVKVKKITFLPVVFLLAGIIYHLFGIGLRWYIAGYAPWSNAYETMVYVSFVTLVAGLLFTRQSAIIFALSALFGGVILFVSGLNWMDPQITPLVPVLKSPWLMIHVAVIVAAYGFFGIGFLLGITNLGLMTFNRKNEPSLLEVRIRELTIINEIALWIGLALMTAGTFVGAVWANESWGRYWGWDPKETWALITILVYVVATHLRLVKKFDNPKLFNALSIIAFFAVLMTYFGVNYYLTGMHSYGG